MASLSTSKDGKRTIQFVATDRKRRSIRLGKIGQRQAERIRDKVEQLAAAVAYDTKMDPKIDQWLKEIDDKLYDRIAKVGLVEPRDATVNHTLRSLIDLFGLKRRDVKDSTRAVWKQAHESVVEVLGPSRQIKTIKPSDADEWRQQMIVKGLAETTIRKRIRTINLIFNWAIRQGFMESNPFSDLRSTSIPGVQKPYVSREDANKVIDALPDHNWRLLFALARYAGLRMPSEGRALRWSDVDWERDRIRVPVPKLEHLPGKEERMIPIFADLRPYLIESFEQAEEGEDRVLAFAPFKCSYMRKVISRARDKAKVKAWQSMFNSLRASCETDLMREFPAHVVCSWIGHDLKIAQRHYLQITEDDFNLAASKKAVQKAVQHGHARGRVKKQGQKKTLPCKSMHDSALQEVGRGGLEQSAKTPGNTNKTRARAAVSSPAGCPDLASALSMIAQLPLTDEEKAETVRKLLA